MWTRNGVFTTQCPKSIITVKSMHFLEKFRYWKEAGGGSLFELDAKEADAVLVLEKAWQVERENAEVER